MSDTPFTPTVGSSTRDGWVCVSAAAAGANTAAAPSTYPNIGRYKVTNPATGDSLHMVASTTASATAGIDGSPTQLTLVKQV